ncbi:MAG: right-handed parallel beta-helix repeat-containing protein [Prevotellaceae bacterium]|nr:right-handed parallel beta-helix repeat-containing protein [Prevotellaceae bacterium]
MFAGVAYGTVRYVTVSGANNKDGLSWTNASDDLQAMINISSSGDQIWVAAGTYKPKYTADGWNASTSAYPTTDGGRNNAFVLKTGVAIYGGFVGNETELSARDRLTNETILSGDFNGDDGDYFINMDENAYHVVISTVQNTALDGFSIIGGNADGSGNITVASISVSQRYGGGISSCINSSMALSSVTISKNQAQNGGGIYYDNDNFSVLTNVTIRENQANYGGGIYFNVATPKLKNVIINENLAHDVGSGIYNSYADISSYTQEWTDVTINENKTGAYGYAVYNNNSSPILINVTISKNQGSGIYNNNSSPELNNVIISENQDNGMDNQNNSSPILTDVMISENQNGGMRNEDSSPILNGVTISKNQAYSGGGMLNFNSSPILNNVTINDNKAHYSGGGMQNESSSPQLTDVTISGNQAGNGGGMYNNNSSPILNGVTISKNQGNGMHNYNSSPELNGVIISKNQGSGMSNYSSSSPKLKNVTISENVTTNTGGGIDNDNSSPTLINVIISENQAENGGGIYNHNNSSPQLTDVIISGNQAGNDGGGVFNGTSSPQLTNVLISGNRAGYVGGGMYNTSSSPQLINVTITGNQADGYTGGGIYNDDINGVACLPEFINSVIWGNGTINIHNYGSNTNPGYSYSLVQDSDGSGNSWNDYIGIDNGNNIDVNPMFNSNYELSAGSPAINAGNNSANSTPTDLAGNARIVDNTIDMGAYEYDKCGKFKDLKIQFSGKDTLCFGEEIVYMPPLFIDSFYITSGTAPKGAVQPYQYIWQYKDNISTVWTDAPFNDSVFKGYPFLNNNNSSFSTDTMLMVRLTVKDAGEECEVMSDTVIIRGQPMIPPLSVSYMPSEICGEWIIPTIQFGSPLDFNTSPVMTFEWEADDNYAAVGLPSKSGIDSIPGFTANINTTNAPIVTDIEVTPKIGYCSGSTLYFSITLHSAPVLSSIPPQTINSGGKATDVILSNYCSNSSATYSWWATSNYAAAGLSSQSGSGNTISFNTAPANTGNSPITVTIYVMPSNGQCFGEQKQFQIIIDPASNELPTLDNLPSSPEICSGTKFFYHPTSATIPTITWSRSAVSGISEAAETDRTGDVDETITNETTSPINVTYTFTLTENSQTNTQTLTVKINPKPEVATIIGDNNVCVGSDITLSNSTLGGSWRSDNMAIATVASDGVVTGVSEGNTTIWYSIINVNGCSDSVSQAITVYSQMVTAINGYDNVCVGSDIILSNPTLGGSWCSDNTAIATVTSDGVVTGVSTGSTTIWYTGCSNSVSKEITVMVDDNYNYPDIRLRSCPSGTFNLSKYIDTVGVHSVSWSSSTGGIVILNGELDASQLINNATYTFKYTVIAGCSNTPVTGKVYLKTLGDNESILWRDTIAICHEYAEAVNIDRLFGIETGATPVTTIPPGYITLSSYGGTIFNGKQFYDDNQPGSDTYHGVNNVVKVEFTCTPSGSCQSGKTYKRVIVLTPDLTK